MQDVSTPPLHGGTAESSATSESCFNDRKTSKKYTEQIRRIRFKDPDSGKTLVFLTNNTALPALTIAALYKSRWQVELFFKWIKQHLRIKRFLATSENAVKTQIWCAIATYVLIAIVKKELKLNASLYTCLQILSVSIFEKTEISCALQHPFLVSDPACHPNQLILFDILTGQLWELIRIAGNKTVAIIRIDISILRFDVIWILNRAPDLTVRRAQILRPGIGRQKRRAIT